jgi:hypothetical protein
VAGERFVILGVAPARAPWFAAVAQWTTSATIAAEFVKCVSGEEVRARLASGRLHSALLIDVGAPSFDRDLVDFAVTRDTPVIAVADGRRPVAIDLPVAAILPVGFGPDDLLYALTRYCRPVGDATRLPPLLEESAAGLWQAPLFTVCGPGGTGASTVAVALASGLSADARSGGRVLLADLARRADQAMLHDSAELGPGVQELVEAHRLSRPGPDEIAGMTFAVPRRGYNLLLGLRQPEHWAALRPRSTDAAVAGLRRSFQAVVADLTGDFEGEAEGGSADVEERNHLARTAAAQATVAVAVGQPGLKGVHSLALLIRQMARAGVDPARILPVLNRSPRHPRARAESARALAALLDAAGLAAATAAPVALPERKLEDALRDGAPLPAALVDPVTRAVAAVASRVADVAPPDVRAARIAPGSLGSWSDDPEVSA